MKLYNFPEKYEKKSEDYEILCEGKRVGAYACRVSAHPFNRVWPGKQRDISQTEGAAYVMLGNDGETRLEITPKTPFQRVAVRPAAKGAGIAVCGGTVSVTFPSAGQYTVEFDDCHHTLMVFIDPEKDLSAWRAGEDVLYFAPGVHYADERILLESGQTVFLDEGCVLYGSLNAVDQRDVRIVGHGVLDNSRMRRQDAIQSTPDIVSEEDPGIGLPIYCNRCENVTVEGITIVDSSEWSMKFTGCKNVLVDNVKLCGMWRYNADGCDFCNTVNATVRNSFLRTFDDCLVVKGLASNRETPVEHILAENCVLWCDWGRCMEVGAETCAPYMRDITFRNCYVIRGSDVVMDVQQGDSGDVEDVTFENIEIEYCGDEQRLAIQTEEDGEYPYRGVPHTPRPFVLVSGVTMWSHDDKAGDMRNITFRNINIRTPDGQIPGGSFLKTREAKSRIENVFFEGVRVNGRACSLRDLGVSVEGNVIGVHDGGERSAPEKGKKE